MGIIYYKVPFSSDTHVANVQFECVENISACAPENTHHSYFTAIVHVHIQSGPQK